MCAKSLPASCRSRTGYTGSCATASGTGNTVVTERLDCRDFNGKGWGLKLPCIGMFDVNEAGKLCGWRDYFDNRMWFENGGPTLHLD